MERIGIRELRQNASTYIDMVWREGVTLEVTNRGRLAAKIIPAEEPEEDPLADLVAAGIIESADTEGDLLDIVPLPPLEDGPTLSEVLAEMRAKERY